MARQVLVNADNVTLPDGGTYNTGDVVVLTDDQFADVASTALGDEVTDQGNVAQDGDAVVTQAAAVAAIATPATATAEDVANKVNEILTALKGTGKPMAAS